MSISDTSFFNDYQSLLGFVYSNGVLEQISPDQTLQKYVEARQSLLQGFSTSEVTTGLTIVNAHLSNEAVYTNATSNVVKSVVQTLNNFYYGMNGEYLRDRFNGLATTRVVAWKNSFKEAYYLAMNAELVQHVGYATWNGTDLVYYPAHSSMTNTQNSAVVAQDVSSEQVVLTGYTTNLSNFALPGDIIVVADNGAMPTPATIGLTTVVTGYANSNTIVLNDNIGVTSGTVLYAFRPIRNAEYLEFRLGTSAFTGSAATSMLSNVVLSVSLTGGTANTTVNVGLGTTNSRVSIGSHTNTAFKATGISSILFVTGDINAFGANKSLEIWTKGTN